MKRFIISIAFILVASSAHALCPVPAAETDAFDAKTHSIKTNTGITVYLFPAFQGSNTVYKAVRLDSDCVSHPLSVESWNGKNLVTDMREDAQLLCYDVKIKADRLRCKNTGTSDYSLAYDYRVTENTLQLLKHTTTLKETGKSTIDYRRKH